jgi:hypothetical protein
MAIIMINKQPFVIYCFSAVILLFSVFLSCLKQDWQWFSRSGSLIVILGIYLTSSQIIENSRRLGQRVVVNNGNFQRDWARDKDKILRDDRYHEKEIWVMGKCGFNLLIMGTFIWGFGDLLPFIFNFL